jgi:hypothetical protein
VAAVHDGDMPHCISYAQKLVGNSLSGLVELVLDTPHINPAGSGGTFAPACTFGSVAAPSKEIWRALALVAFFLLSCVRSAGSRNQGKKCTSWAGMSERAFQGVAVRPSDASDTQITVAGG